MLFAMLNSDVHTGVMKNTPRKNIFTRKVKDDSRFLTYLAVRAGWVGLSMFFVAWVSLASIFKGSESWTDKMVEFHTIDIRSSSSSSSIKGFFLLQDIISSTYVLSIITQSITLLQRGIGLMNFPNLSTHIIYYISIIMIMIIHGFYLAIRSYLRSDIEGGGDSYNYKDLDWIVWFFLFLFPFLGIFIIIYIINIIIMNI